MGELLVAHRQATGVGDVADRGRSSRRWHGHIRKRCQRARHPATTGSAGSLLHTNSCRPRLLSPSLRHCGRTDWTDENLAGRRFPRPPVAISRALVPTVRTEESILLRRGGCPRWLLSGRRWHAEYVRCYLLISLTLVTNLYQLMTAIGALLHYSCSARPLLHKLKLAPPSKPIRNKT